jgi:putative DNA primase/helicase
VHGSRGPTLALRDGEHGLIVKCFAGCDLGDILVELRHRGLVAGTRNGGGGGLRPDAEAIRLRRKAEETERRRRSEDARRLWEAAQDARGSPVVRYLASRRITLTPPPSLRWAPRCWHRGVGSYLPATIGLVEHVDHGMAGVHRIYLTPDLCRRDRASLGPIRGGAVRLGPASELLMVSEGIETALAAMQACALPAWAALSTSGMVTLVLPPIVRTVVILADHDENGAGERAARLAADRWLAEGRRVRIAMPPAIGQDFNDVLLGDAYARITEASDVAA